MGGLGKVGGVAPRLDCDAWTVNDAGLAAVFGVSRNAVKKWVQAGMPKAGRGSYYLPACVQWKLDRTQDQLGAEPRDVVDLRQELTVQQVEKLRLENATTRGELVDLEDVRAVLNRLVNAFSSGMEALGPRLSGELVNVDTPSLISKTVTAETRKIRADMATILRRWAAGDDIDEPSESEEQAA